MKRKEKQHDVANQDVNQNPATIDRQQELQTLYAAEYGDLWQLAYETEPSLLPQDGDSILALLAERLPKYRGKATPEPFNRWARGQVSKLAQQFSQTSEILQKNSRVIYSAIFNESDSYAMDSSVDADDLFSEISALVFRYAGSLSKRGTARVSTRLYALVRQHCYYHLKKRRRRLELVEQFGSSPEILAIGGGIPVISTAEAASMWHDKASGPYVRSETM